MNLLAGLIGLVLLIAGAGWWHGQQEARVRDGLIDLMMNNGYTACAVQRVHLPFSALVDGAVHGQALVHRDDKPTRAAAIDLRIVGSLRGEQPVHLQLEGPAVATLRHLGC